MKSNTPLSRLNRIEQLIRGTSDLNEIRELLLREANPAGADRVEYICMNYKYDPLLDQIISQHTGNPLARGAVVHAGRGRSPVSQTRARWFLEHGTDPRHISKRGRDLVAHE